VSKCGTLKRVPYCVASSFTCHTLLTAVQANSVIKQLDRRAEPISQLISSDFIAGSVSLGLSYSELDRKEGSREMPSPGGGDQVQEAQLLINRLG
jgi:hypothetical protein